MDLGISHEMPRRPTSYEEVGEAVHAAGKTRMRVRVVGSGSMGGGVTRFEEGEGARGVVEISTLRLNKIVEHAVADMTVIVQAGITVEALQKQLAWRDQWLPVDAPAANGRSPMHRTIGGMIASNSLGPLRFGAGGGGGGDWRFLMMGMKWVDAQGRLITGGGRTVKNVAGYSTPRMMIGSCGSLGVIAEVTLRTFARPADEQCIIFFCPSAEVTESLMAEVMLSATTPAYIEVVDGNTFAGNPLGLPSMAGDQVGMALVVGFMGRAEVCAAQLEVVRGLAWANGLEKISQTAAQAGRLRLWMTSEPGHEGGGEDGRTIGFRIHTLSSHVSALVAAIEGVDKSAWVVAEAGSGIVRGQLGNPAVRDVVEIAVQGRGHSCVVWSDKEMVGGPKKMDIYGRVKRALDPEGIFGSSPLPSPPPK